MLPGTVHHVVIEHNLVDGLVPFATAVEITGEVRTSGKTVNDDAYQTEQEPTP